jgi:hypothetical protein
MVFPWYGLTILHEEVVDEYTYRKKKQKKQERTLQIKTHFMDGYNQ